MFGHGKSGSHPDSGALTVLAAAAAEANELLAREVDLPDAARNEADRRIRLFFAVAESAR